MRSSVLLDTGPLVALLNRRDRYHRWVLDRFAEIEPPLLTCEAVLTEASHLLRHAPGGARALFEFLKRGVLEIPFQLSREAGPVDHLLHRYADLPISLADACLVRMAELHAGSRVLSLNADFQIYRMHGRRVVPAILPHR